MYAQAVSIRSATERLTDADFESQQIKNARKDEVKELAALYAIR